MKIAIVGSREFKDKKFVQNTVTTLMYLNAPLNGNEFIS
jgi:hypothetical protein